MFFRSHRASLSTFLLAGFASILLTSFLLTACTGALPLPLPDSTPAIIPESPTASPQPAVRATTTPLLSPEPTPTALHQLQIQAPDLKGETVRFIYPWNDSTGSEVQKIVRRFNDSNHWGIRVDATAYATLDELVQVVSNLMDSGSPPDLVVGYPYHLLDWDKRKGIVDLAPFISNPTWGFSATQQADFYPIFWEQDVINGKRLGLPAQRSARMLFYNVSLAKELGFSQPPATPEEFRQQACAAAQVAQKGKLPGSEKAGGYLLDTNYSISLGWIHAFGGEVTGPGVDRYNFDTQPFKDTFTYLRNLYDKGCAWLPDNVNAEDQFAGRRALFINGSLMTISYQVQRMHLANNGDIWTVLPFPSPAGRPVMEIYGPSYAIFNTSPRKELATWLFLKEMLTPDNQASLTLASGSYPLRASVPGYISAQMDTQWMTAVQAIPQGNNDPVFMSWNTVRWALSDATLQLFRYYFTIDQVTSLAAFLDSTADDLRNGPPTPAAPPTSTPPATATATRTRIPPAPSATPTVKASKPTTILAATGTLPPAVSPSSLPPVVTP